MKIIMFWAVISNSFKKQVVLGLTYLTHIIKWVVFKMTWLTPSIKEVDWPLRLTHVLQLGQSVNNLIKTRQPHLPRPTCFSRLYKSVKWVVVGLHDFKCVRVRVDKYFAQTNVMRDSFCIYSEARKSFNRPPTEEVLANLIYNYSPTYCGTAG